MALEGGPCSEVASSFITIIVVRFVSFSHFIPMQAWRGSRRHYFSLPFCNLFTRQKIVLSNWSWTQSVITIIKILNVIEMTIKVCFSRWLLFNDLPISHVALLNTVVTDASPCQFARNIICKSHIGFCHPFGWFHLFFDSGSFSVIPSTKVILCALSKNIKKHQDQNISNIALLTYHARAERNFSRFYWAHGNHNR